ncbi:MAG: hypothetical protein FWC11_03140, partial [Firmicutes bacterium]|nr:hypothetical protein [Bacillota bacterium]
MVKLVKTKNDVSLTSPTTAEHIMAFCRVITPQFYKGLSRTDMVAEKMAIEMLTSNIDPPVLQKMCELATQNYRIARSESPKTFFDINYILTFYRIAFNMVWCDDVEIPSCYECSSDATFDEATRIITERWYSESGSPDIIIKFIVERKYDDRYDKKHGN